MRHLLTLALLGAIACDGTSPSTPEDGPYPLTRLSPNGAAYASNSGLHSTELGVVIDQQGWDDLYLRIWTGVMAGPIVGPELDFHDSTLVYMGIGYFPNASASVHLDSARIEEGGLVVHYTRTTVGELCGVASVAIAPVEVAQVPRWDGPIRFVQYDSLQVCD